jgi:hypothetical protein
MISKKKSLFCGLGVGGTGLAAPRSAARFFFHFSPFCQKFTFTPLGVVILTLDPGIGAATYSAEVTCLDVIRHGADVSSPGLRGIRCDVDVAGSSVLS